ncbi:hypothetical protein [Pseudoalteromonas sp. T1lg75]|uniref:hypothetical protein n=1 Tax=Pseudoalteromonas sp. T1lg75 TaxID=2077102 RepID=UPI000CF6FFC8|nr:hypothetical protein [Pseudoalteromonas sp. T1lg75]
MASTIEWRETRVEFDRYSLQIDLPNRESKDFPRKEELGSIKIGDKRFDEGANSITAIDKYWDFNGGIFKAVDGTLNIKIRFRKVPTNKKIDATNHHELGHLLLEMLAASGVTIPDNTTNEFINDNKWVSYRLSGKQDFLVYVYPLNNQYYLQVQANFISNTKGESSSWRHEAEDMFNAVLNSVKIGRN